MKTIILFIALVNGAPTNETITINKKYPLTSPESFTVMVNNLYGSISVELSPDNNVYLELEIVISANSESLLEKAKKELELGESLDQDSLVLFTEAPFIKKRKWRNFSGFEITRKPGYSFKYQYKLKLPRQTSLYAKTVSKGDVFVKDLNGIVKVCNVDGDVEIKNAVDVREASTVNGDVTINFVKNPTESVNFNTVNGDFNFLLPSDFSGKIYFNSMNGDLFTAFDYESIKPKVEKSSEHGTFKIGTKTGVEIGSGGPEFSFRSINGNVYLKKSEISSN